MAKKQKVVAVKSTKKGVYLTPKGLADAKAELEFLKSTKRFEIAARIQQAREYGDLAENSEYDAALEEQNLTENRISELENVLKNKMDRDIAKNCC